VTQASTTALGSRPRTTRPVPGQDRSAGQRHDRQAAARNGTPVRPSPRDGTWPLPYLSFYERFIDDGIADADIKGAPVGHVTARRLAIWLDARPQSPVFARSLVQFVHPALSASPSEPSCASTPAREITPNKPQAARLMYYCVARGADTGPVGEDFGAICDQIDRADVMLAGLRERARQGLVSPQSARPEPDGQQVIALARRDPQGCTVSLILDAATANIALFAIAAHADEREAHLREIKRSGQNLPEGSYGRRNRETIAARETRVATRLRAVEHAYRTAIERDDTQESLEPTRTLCAPELHASMQTDMEAEP
jgi:hypothetical protein